MTNDNETRNYESILADNRQLLDSNEVLQLRVGQMRATIADYQRADAVASAMAKNNDVLGTYMDYEGKTWKLQPDKAKPKES